MKIKWSQHRLRINNCHHTCMDDLFASYYIAKKTRHFYYQNCCVRINHQIIKQNAPISQHDSIEITCIPVGNDDSCHPSNEPLPIIYEDDVFLIVNKPCGMLVHSDGYNSDTTLYDLVKGYYIRHAIHANVRAIHRLDMDTTGAVIFCKIAFFQPLLDHMLEEKHIKRSYIALCNGIMTKDNYKIQAGIARDRHTSKMRISSTGKEARTDVRVRKRYTDYTYIECHLHQGRTHQIRVHLSSIGYPLLSDTLYGTNDSRIHRCALHAANVTLYHPLQQKSIQIECPIPQDIKRLLK